MTTGKVVTWELIYSSFGLVYGVRSSIFTGQSTARLTLAHKRALYTTGFTVRRFAESVC